MEYAGPESPTSPPDQGPLFQLSAHTWVSVMPSLTSCGTGLLLCTPGCNSTASALTCTALSWNGGLTGRTPRLIQALTVLDALHVSRVQRERRKGFIGEF